MVIDGNHFEMYRNIESLCCSSGSNIVLYRSNIPQKQTNILIEKEIRLMVTRSKIWGEAELDEGGQKVQTSSYKLNKY